MWPKAGAAKDKWWECRCQLMRFMGRAEWLHSHSDEIEEELLKSMRDEPLVLYLVGGERISVYPKGFDALMWFRAHDWALEWMHVRCEHIKHLLETGKIKPPTEDDFYDPLEIIEGTEREIGHQLAMMAYACTMPGPTIDYDAVTDPPEMFRDLHPADMVRVYKAYVELNQTRLNLAETVVRRVYGGKKKHSSRPMSWNVFLPTMARQLRVDVKELMRDRSLVSVLAQVYLTQPPVEDMNA